jgi:hypothetical protein
MQSMAYMKRYAPPPAPALAGAYQDDEPLPDDEPLGRLPAAQTQAPPPPATNGGLVLKTECEFPARIWLPVGKSGYRPVTGFPEHPR